MFLQCVLMPLLSQQAADSFSQLCQVLCMCFTQPAEAKAAGRRGFQLTIQACGCVLTMLLQLPSNLLRSRRRAGSCAECSIKEHTRAAAAPAAASIHRAFCSSSI